MAIEQFRHYIWGRRFVLYTDHQALTHLFNQNRTNSRLLRWKLALSEYDFQILYRSGPNNVVSDCLSRLEYVEISDLIKNSATKAVMQAITRSRAKENIIIGEQSPQIQTYHIHEDPGLTLDTQKYDRILFLVDGRENLSLKKLQIGIKRKINTENLNSYKLYTMGEKIDIIVVPKINFTIDRLSATIQTFMLTCKKECFERIAINCGVSNFRTLGQFKQLLRDTFRGSQVSMVLFTGTRMEITDIRDINEILKIYHTSLLGGHRGFNRMKNTIAKHYSWPTMNTDIKKSTIA